MTVPRLITALTGPLPDLERELLKATPAIEHWLRSRWQEHAAPFYASVDLRNSGFKLAPVDTNLFPGGFNNLNPDDPGCPPNRFYAYGVIARLALLAAAIELEAAPDAVLASGAA